ncbi:hypothetical protein KAU33_08395 [Candidatus Dependentiae bacterium]|nr:hypothetical protein [Candidatus Dependentiae bacterium]
MNKRHVKIFFFSILFILILIGLFYTYSLVKLDEKLHLIEKEHEHHMGELAEDDPGKIDNLLMKDLVKDHEPDGEHHHKSDDHNHHTHVHTAECEHSEHDHEPDYVHIEWVNKPYFNPIYKANLLFKTLFILLIIIILFIYTYIIDKSKTLKEDNEIPQ